MIKLRKTLLVLVLIQSLCSFAISHKFQPAEAIISNGKLLEYKNFPSQLVKERNVYVWLPDGYSSEKRYNVIYMHDGQMLFDATQNWNKQEWCVDENISELLNQNKIKDCIVVGIWNCPESRINDYFPRKALDYMSDEAVEEFAKGQPLKLEELYADNYLKFIVTELKPFIDSNFSTLTDRDNTFLMGSSMGGLISLYGLCEYPEIFGGSASLSIHILMVLPNENYKRNTELALSGFLAYLDDKLPQANTSKIYIDYGNKTLDALYSPYLTQLDNLLIKKGWTVPYWTTNFYAGADHSETAWAKRLFVPLTFLLEN